MLSIVYTTVGRLMPGINFHNIVRIGTNKDDIYYYFIPLFHQVYINMHKHMHKEQSFQIIQTFSYGYVTLNVFEFTKL